MAVAQIPGRHQVGIELDLFRFVFVFLYTFALEVSKRNRVRQLALCSNRRSDSLAIGTVGTAIEKALQSHQVSWP